MDLHERWKRPEPAVLLTIMGRAMNWMPSLPVWLAAVPWPEVSARFLV